MDYTCLNRQYEYRRVNGSLCESFTHLLLQMAQLLCAHVENVALYPHERF